MGCSKSKYDHKHAMKNNPFFVGPQIFVNLQAHDIHSRYKFIKELGKGAFGEVRLVENLETKKLRAMKKIKINTPYLDEKIFFGEVQVLLYMDHPNILQILEAFKDSKNYYVVTEYLEGGDFYDRIIKQEYLDEPKLASYMKQVFQAISHCNSCGIIHRDIKPQNIMFENQTPDAQLKLIDFGAAKHMSDQDYGAEGTPLYIAPDIFQDEYDEQCDMWSCGMMLFQLLTGKFPFNDKQDRNGIIQFIKEKPLDFTVINSAPVSNQAKEFVKKLLAKNPKNRLTVSQALKDPWIVNTGTKTKIAKSSMQNLAEFHCHSKLKCAILQLIATQLTASAERNKIIDQFKLIDNNHDGKLQKEELEQVFIKLEHDVLKAKHRTEEIFKAVDFNQSGTIDYSEFLVAAAKYDQLRSKQKVEEAFKLIDQDNNGYITIAELQRVMAGAKNSHWEELIKDFDQDRDGRISHQEFIDTIIKKTTPQEQLSVQGQQRQQI